MEGVGGRVGERGWGLGRRLLPARHGWHPGGARASPTPSRRRLPPAGPETAHDGWEVVAYQEEGRHLDPQVQDQHHHVPSADVLMPPDLGRRVGRRGWVLGGRWGGLGGWRVGVRGCWVGACLRGHALLQRTSPPARPFAPRSPADPSLTPCSPRRSPRHGIPRRTRRAPARCPGCGRRPRHLIARRGMRRGGATREGGSSVGGWW